MDCGGRGVGRWYLVGSVSGRGHANSGRDLRRRGGDTIYVHAGTYVENVNVGKRLTLTGDGAGTAATNVYRDIGDKGLS